MKKNICLAIIIGLCLGVTCCGKDASDDEYAVTDYENIGEDDVEEAFTKLEEEYGGDTEYSQETAVNEENQEIQYVEFEPTDEIINADLRSGKIQILDDVFQTGGYITIDEFIQQYGEKYDFTTNLGELKVDEFAEVGNYVGATLDRSTSGNKVYRIEGVRKDITFIFEDEKYAKKSDVSGGSDVGIALYYVLPTEQHTRLGDCIVYDITSVGRAQCWYPGGYEFEVNGQFSDFTYENFVDDFIMPIGLGDYSNEHESVNGLFLGEDSDYYEGKKFAVDGYRIIEGKYEMCILGENNNLLGIKPAYCFVFRENEKDGTIKFANSSISPYYYCELVSDPSEW